MTKQQDKTYFGFKQVNKSEKVDLVGEVFSEVAEKYDLMNNAMSLGVHHLWKKSLIKHFPHFKGKLLDMASGTGDIANLFFHKAQELGVQNPQIFACDINFEMLKNGKNKIIDENKINRQFSYCTADAENLPFSDGIFDYYTIAFGIRNVTNIDKALSEAFRVLKVGGKFICLEFSEVQGDVISNLYDYYSFNIIPKIGKLLASNENAYQYLVESIKQFPNQNDFASLISEAGFKMVKYENLTKGVSAIHSGYKI